MRRQITRVLLAATVAGATVTTLGLMGASTAAASTTAITGRVFTQHNAGYFTGSGTRRFRFIGTSVTVAPCQPTTVIADPAGNPNAEIWLSELAPAAASTNFAKIAVACGGGSGSVTFGDDFHTTGILNLSPSVGDVLRISIFHSVQGFFDEFTATNARTGRTQVVLVATASVVYRHAQADSFIPDNSAIIVPHAKIHLWDFASTDVTTNSGVHGSLLGPWATFKLVDSVDGTSATPVVMFATSLSNSGHNFSTWLNPAS